MLKPLKRLIEPVVAVCAPVGGLVTALVGATAGVNIVASDQ